ncbi:MAG: OmpA/MotB family protein [Pirellulaceae bacterium]
MALIQEEETRNGAPEWIVTFGDMMSLLLTFFIMLASLSEIKREEPYEAMVESILQQFGYDSTMMSLAPGALVARNARLAQLATAGRARRVHVMQGGDRAQAPVGDDPRVRIVRIGEKTNFGGVIFFDENSAELTDRAQTDLRVVAESLRGKPQKIEVRGHASPRPLPHDAPARTPWDLAYQRSWNTVRYLVDQLDVAEERFRIAIAGPHEPMHITADATRQRYNPRVEILMLDEVVSDLMGTKDEQNQRFTDGDIPSHLDPVLQTAPQLREEP